MRLARYIAVILLLLVGGLWGAVRVVPWWQARQFTPVMSAYLQAAATGDSVGLDRVTTSSAPVRWGFWFTGKSLRFSTRQFGELVRSGWATAESDHLVSYSSCARPNVPRSSTG